MIGSINSSTSASMMNGMSGRGRMQRPDPAAMASQIFSQLDTKNQGYIEKSDLASALAALQNGSSTSGTSSTSSTSSSASTSSSSSSSSNSSNVDALFSQLDSNSDGKVTADEFSTSMQQLADALDSQFNQMRMDGHGKHGGGQPPPPPGNDSGFTQDQLSSQLQSIGNSDSQRASLISKIVDNFSAADSDGNGKVSFAEAQAFDQSQQSGSSSSSTSVTASSTSSNSSGSDSGSSASSDTTQAQLMRQIMQLMHAYGRPAEQSSFSSLLQTSA